MEEEKLVANEELEEEQLEETDESVEEEKEEPTQDEEKGKFYTDEELNELVNEIADRRVARKMKKYEQQMAKYKDTENVLKSQIGGENIDEVNANLRKIYEEDGRTLPKEYKYENDRDLYILGRNDAEDFIKDGLEATEEEANRLARIGYKNLNAREQSLFNALCENITEIKNEKELLKLGASKDLLQDKDFVEFKKQFNVETPIKNIYELYINNKKPVKEVKTPGSLVGKSNSNNGVKDYYTYEEASKFTREELESNPELFKAIENSMSKW